MIKNQTPYTYGLLTLSLCLVVVYIVCIYKTVIVASEHEVEKKAFGSLQVSVGEKEHAYIQENTQFDIEGAIALGYIKTPEAHISFIELNKDTSLAIR